MKKIWWILMVALLGACTRTRENRPHPSQVLTAAPALAADPRPAIVCFGDSLTAGFGVDPGKSYPDLLQQELDRRGYRYRVVNMGVSGDTTQDGLERLPLVLAEKPRIVVLEFGANDGLRGQPVSIPERNLAQMAEALEKTGARVVLAGITLPPNYGPEYLRQFDAIYPGLAKRYKMPLIPFLLGGAAGNQKLMQSDGLHPNTEGTRVMVENVWRALEPLLEKE
jgi:acyl-CoA thioesterase-1